MCLRLLEKPRIQRRNRPVAVFKILRCSWGQFKSPFRAMRYCFGETKSVAEFSANDSANDFHGRLLFRDSFPPEISGGIFKGLHGYETLPAAQRGAYSGDCIIVRCIIPPNTPFIRGKKGEIVALALTIGKAVYGQEFLVRQFNGE